MASSARIIWKNHVFGSGVTVTASTALANRPAQYAAHPARKRRWVSSTTSSQQWVMADFGAPVLVEGFAAVDYQSQNGAAILAQTSDDGLAWATYGVLSQPLNNRSGVTLVSGLGLSKRYARLLFDTTGAPGAASLGVFVCGQVYVPTRDIADNPELLQNDPSLVSQSIGRQEYAHIREQYASLTGRFPSEADADRDAMAAIFAEIGSSRPCVFSYDRDVSSHTWWGRFTMPYTRTHQLGMYHDMPFSFMEVL